MCHGVRNRTASFHVRAMATNVWQTASYGGYRWSIVRVEPATDAVQVFPLPDGSSRANLEPPTRGQGARRVWSDSRGVVWVSEWNGGNLARYDPVAGAWREWPLPGAAPRPDAVYVDDCDVVWLSDFSANAIVRFDPEAESFEVFELPSPGAQIRQILGRPGEVWGGESGTDKLLVIRTR